MFIQADTVDDLLNEVLLNLLERPFEINTHHGKTSEIFGVLLKLNNPLARLSRTETRGLPFSALGELFWYLSGSNNFSFIEHYIPKYPKDGESEQVYGGYGPRLFNMHERFNQVKTVINLLKTNPNTRRAVIQIFDAEDNDIKRSEIPCTCTFQFAVRNGKLDMFTTMRSNDAFIGFPHDVFCFTMLQEIIACSTNYEVGVYYHSVGSLHLYEKDKDKAVDYLREGYQSTKIMMPKMASLDPWSAIDAILKLESQLRKEPESDYSGIGLDKYWMDIIYLLQIHSNLKCKNYALVRKLSETIDNKMYRTYIENKLRIKGERL